MKKFIFIILTLCCLSGFSQSNTDPELIKVENGLTKQTIVPNGEVVLTKNINDRLRDYKVNGVSIAVINNYSIEWAKTYGVADNLKGNPLSQETLFQCASIGKIITAMAALQLVREQKIELDENVNIKLTSWKVEENKFTIQEKVTLRRLLSHSAGLFDEYGFEGYSPKDQIPTLLQILRNEPPSKAKKILKVEAVPGTVERYSGGSYLIVQQLIEDVTGQSFDVYIEKNLFAPLGMINSTYNYRPDINLKKEIARGHYKNGKIDKKKEYQLYPERAAAGPWTTAEDLAKLVIQIQKEYTGKSDLIIGQALCKEMLTPQINQKGLAVNLKGLQKPEAFWHAGNNAGYISLLYGILNTGQGAIVLTNSDAGEQLALEVITSVANAYDWPVMKSHQATDLTKHEIIDFIGIYEAENGSKVTIGENSKGLFVIPASPKKEISLYKIGEDMFTTEGAPDYFSISFNREGDRISGITFTQSFGKVSTLKRIK